MFTQTLLIPFVRYQLDWNKASDNQDSVNSCECNHCLATITLEKPPKQHFGIYRKPELQTNAILVLLHLLTKLWDTFVSGWN